MNAHANGASGPRFRTPFGFLAALRKDPLGNLMSWRRQYGDFVEIPFGLGRTYLVFHPRDVRHVLHENHKNYWKGVVLGKLKRIAGEGLVFSDGDLWRRQRKLVQPAFHRDRITAMAQMMTASTAAMLDRWESHARTGPLNVAAEATKLTLEIVARALFGTSLGDDEAEFSETVTAGMAYANHLMNHFLAWPIWIPTRANRAGRAAIRTMDRIVHGLIERRRRDERPAEATADLLGMLIEARDEETHVTMNDRQLRDEVVTFLVAGHETTAVTLAWTWHLLASHPEIEARLHAEIAEVLGQGVPAFRDLERLRYTRMVIEEAMRLYPPAWGISRQAYQEDRLGERRIAKGTVVTLSAYVTHRHPEFWPDPEHFDPERFSPGDDAGRPEYAYFPFGGGPRRCIGNQFAMMEAQLILAMTSQRFRMSAVPGYAVKPDPILTLRPNPGVLMTLAARA
ncbi:MAG: cytochrome P450 [Candidatus Binatia bacterium]